ncbi:hypothetical protein TVAG_128330 [Trichomonas vaginalis G3]|uniref:Ankyrin repeat protein n=1 Tax=Trichomonas vaginalis (strain ATCC PRA-98 / G3) TaxID=412133 RepID=A2EBJ4_TRIV3|nr:hypothetical protein TVAGG3_0407220 [Trichomonas vaginalis G3]EAY10024.1 hypothetical protein TVAG_128330 [Trichomonas vaginalis G3]KAI5535104.1 hypothetical protein TVAGG3_0407220 [Trichomonas vaginalis G3]|eukprot:XP_001322247.1 hypothetical protein [Trichomonas vaginalis G3]
MNADVLTVDYLLKKGATKSIKDNQNRTPILYIKENQKKNPDLREKYIVIREHLSSRKKDNNPQ